ncbi:MAG: GAF domain-containing sensor histidine kinase [Candidatus Cloacimonetes bacterium]|nr:GAF domain-containing sensor histidine kinase [Candidatus Cloacimonadota bacterium]
MTDTKLSISSLKHQIKEKDDKILALEKKLVFFQNKLLLPTGDKDTQLALLNQTYQNELLLETITNINSFMSKSGANNSILFELIEQAAMMVDCAASSILLLTKDRKSLYFKTATGDASEEIKKFTVPLDKGISGLVVRTETPVIINDPYSHVEFNPSFDKLTGFVTRSILCIPLFHESEVIGALQLINNLDKNGFDQDDLEMAQLFADQAGIAIAKSIYLEELEVKNQELIEANKLKTNFISTISHELRTPLTPIIAWSDCLIESLDDPEFLNEGLQTIKEQAYHLNRIIDSIIQLSQLDAKQIYIDWQEASFEEILTRVISDEQKLIKLYGMTLDYTHQGTEAFVMSDSNILYQIIFQVLDNAIKFGDRNSTVSIKLIESSDTVTLTIINDCPGMDENDLEIICTRFRQLDNSLTRAQDGLGIGLTLVQGLSNLIGAQFNITSSIPDRWVCAELIFLRDSCAIPKSHTTISHL